MRECSFCKKNYDEARGGFTLFKRDGSALHFDSRKCARNHEMKRVARKLKWTRE